MTHKPAADHLADDEPHAPEAKVHHEPTSAHTDAPVEHARDMEGLGRHGDEHTSDGHGHGEPRLGPIDWGAWAYAILGVAVGLLVVVAFSLATT